MDLMGMVLACAPMVAPQTMVALVQVESSRNPYAIGVVGGALARQPRSLPEALAAVASLEKQGRNFSVGIAQVNRYNLPKYKLSYAQAFDPCANLRAGGKILHECYVRALPKHPQPQAALRAAFSCYYSGNFTRGFRPDKPGDPSYVDKVVAAAGVRSAPQVQVPAIAGAAPLVAADTAPPAPAPVRRIPESPVLVGDDGRRPATESDDSLAGVARIAVAEPEPEPAITPVSEAVGVVF